MARRGLTRNLIDGDCIAGVRFRALMVLDSRKRTAGNRELLARRMPALQAHLD